MFRHMRTTLTLDDDIAVQLTQVREARKMSLRNAVNAAMRLGLTQMMNPAQTRKKTCHTPVFHADAHLAALAIEAQKP